MTMTLIQTYTVGAGGIAAIDFTTITNSYTDLLVVWNTRDNVAGNQNNLQVTFNGSTTGYSERIVYGNGSSASSLGNSGSNFSFVYSVGASATANTFSNGQMYIPNYAGGMNKIVGIDVVGETAATSALQVVNAAMWSNTAAITRVTLTSNGGTLQQYSTASIYGILKGSGGATVSP